MRTIPYPEKATAGGNLMQRFTSLWGAIGEQILITGGNSHDAIDSFGGDVRFKQRCGETLGGVEFETFITQEFSVPVFRVLLKLGNGLTQNVLSVLNESMFE
ncbi:hypothetical protein [Spirulina major]|uniref:hypothetical protein n=2 Tax=Spirulina TaxID=1154 RepID=UPI00232DF071|nr:hypothetical protein [Spirulina major]